MGVTVPGRYSIFARPAAAVNPEFLGKRDNYSILGVIGWLWFLSRRLASNADADMRPNVPLATVKVLIDESNQRNQQRHDREYPLRVGPQRSKLEGTRRQAWVAASHLKMGDILGDVEQPSRHRNNAEPRPPRGWRKGYQQE